MVGILGFHYHDLCSVPGQRAEIPQAVLHGQKEKKIKTN